VDPLTEMTGTPYQYCYQNPVKYIDPTGMKADWHEDGNGNLVADKGDSAKTLGEYLNTTTEIATKIIGASELSTNEQGNVEEGATIALGYTIYPSSLTEDLGFLGNQIRDRAGSDFSKEMFVRYWNGNGDYNMGVLRFASILNYMKKNPKALGESNSITLSDGSTGKFTIVNFYNSKEYALVLGKSTIYSNSEDKNVGFYDTYDFDSKEWGKRSFKNELKTRAVEGASFLRRLAMPNSAKAFKIKFGQQKK